MCNPAAPEKIIGPRRMGYLTISIVALAGIALGWSAAHEHPIVTALAALVLLISITSVVDHVWRLMDAIADISYSRGLHHRFRDHDDSSRATPPDSP